MISVQTNKTKCTDKQDAPAFGDPHPSVPAVRSPPAPTRPSNLRRAASVSVRARSPPLYDRPHNVSLNHRLYEVTSDCTKSLGSRVPSAALL